jgi:predicted exporter
MPPEINCGSYVKAAMIGRTLYCATSGVLLLALARRQRRKEMTDFLAQMPTDTKIFVTMAVLGLAGMLIVLRRLI